MNGSTPNAWDPVVRLSHWLIALLFFANYWLLEAGEKPHEWAGLSLVAILAARLIWGFIGPANARLKALTPSPEQIRRQLKGFRRSYEEKTGHTPLSALMILVTWIVLLLSCLTGWLQTTDRFWGEEWLQESHEIVSDLALALALLHITTVVILSLWLKRSLIKPMLIPVKQKD